MLTLKILKDMPPYTVFARGEIEDSPKGINMANTGKIIKWVAKRGRIHDWAIYCDNPYTPFGNYDTILKMGDKVTGEQNIKKLVECDDEAFEMYRY